MILTAITSLGLLCAHEMMLKSLGVTPGLQNTPASWSDEFDRLVTEDQRQSVVLIGSSRIQNGIDPKLLSEQLGGAPVYNLSISGTGSLHVLEHLADHTSYRGMVVVEFWPTRQLNAVPPSTDKAETFITSRDKEALIDPLENRLDQFFELNLRFLHPNLNTITTIKTILRHRIFPFPLETYNAERYGSLRYDRQPNYRLEKLVRDGNKEFIDAHPVENVEERRAAFERPISKLRKRGARILLFNPVITDRSREIEDARWPKKEYWDILVPSLSDASLHYQDDADLIKLKCVDSVHVNWTDVPIQTRALSRYIRPLM